MMIRPNPELLKSVKGQNAGQWHQIRTLKRKLAYPEAYTPNVPPQNGKKDHSSYFQRAIKSWLGPKNLRGEYYRNKYYYPPQNHQPNYVVQDGITVVGAADKQATPRGYGSNKRDSSLHPFPMNLECKTASIISNQLKTRIYEDATVRQLKHEEIAQKYGIKIARIEAIIKLYGIEQQWNQSNKVTQDLQKFSDIMYKMFPLYNAPVEAENLTEIPAPQRTLHQRFLTISESEPFGPVDAAKVFELEPASETLHKLTEIDDTTHSDNINKTPVVVGSQKQGDRSLFKFTHAKSGSVGHRYGASRRDKKRNRDIGFDRTGGMVNLV